MLKFIQLPAFEKQEAELVTRKDKWFYFLQNLEDLGENIRELFQNDNIFSKMISISEIAKLSPDEYQNYEVSRLQYLELKGIADTAFLEGEQAAEEKFSLLLQQMEAETQEERRLKEEERRQKEELAVIIVKTLQQSGKTPEEIALISKISLDEVIRIIQLL